LRVAFCTGRLYFHPQPVRPRAPTDLPTAGVDQRPRNVPFDIAQAVRGLGTAAERETLVAEVVEAAQQIAPRAARDEEANLLGEHRRGDGKRLVGFALSEGSMTTLLEVGASEAEVGLDRLCAVASTIKTPIPWWIGYRAWIGLR
jgi:hypothetical protein